MFIGPIVVWTLLRFALSRVVLTTSSAGQLTTQTEPSIRRWATKWNTYAKLAGINSQIIIKENFFYCTSSHGHAKLFATDEAGKAEGFHPELSADGAKLVMIVNEAKNVKDIIYDALYRCRGWTDFLEISSPEKCSGEFYKNSLREDVVQVKIKWTECPHITKEEHDRDLERHGGNVLSPWYLSSYMAEFADPTSDAAIPAQIVSECLRSRPEKTGDALTIGVDIAVVCDEIVVTGYRGNHWKFTLVRTGFPSMTHLEDWLHEIFTDKQPRSIFMDYDGIGRGVVDNLVNRKGWDIVGVQNGSSAHRSNLYCNRGTELVANLRRLIENRLITLDPQDAKLHMQLGTRRVISRPGGKQILESKKEMKKRGLKSPDRMDSLVLATCNLYFEDLIGKVRKTSTIVDVDAQVTVITDDDDYRKYLKTQQTPRHKWKTIAL